ncbi:hypothetical protein ALC53_05456 [Atta colombica]|uniref:Uncharacterized protein n=1 Tax=Atta colombica TaxID=520822 RepID=A0A195BHR4_9HYME|nr:hypothetical protein ALC53_05456 [Atta colombica]
MMATVGGDCTGRTYNKKARVGTFDLVPLASKTTTTTTTTTMTTTTTTKRTKTTTTTRMTTTTAKRTTTTRKPQRFRSFALCDRFTARVDSVLGHVWHIIVAKR